MTNAPARPPQTLRLKRGSRLLEVDLGDEGTFALPCTFLRKHSPAADAGGGEPDSNVTVLRLEPVGNYAVRPVFSDGHATGIYSWTLLRELCRKIGPTGA